MIEAAADVRIPTEFEIPTRVLEAIEQQVLDSEAIANSAPNRRRHTRLTIYSVCRIDTVCDYQITSRVFAYTRNISVAGVGILSKRHFDPGQTVSVEVYESPDFPLQASGVVRFCRHVTDGVYEIGIKLTSAKYWRLPGRRHVERPHVTDG
jgi:hypothetical protein